MQPLLCGDNNRNNKQPNYNMRVILLIFCLGQICLAGPITEPKFVGDWSETTNGLRGRLLLGVYPQDAFHAQHNSKQAVVYIELQNITSIETIYVSYDPIESPLRCELKNSNGDIVKPNGVALGDLRPAPCRLALPRDSSLRFSATFLAGAPSDSLLISVGEMVAGGAWEIPLESTNVYYLSGTFSPTLPANETNPHVWEGTLKLPPVKISTKDIK